MSLGRTLINAAPYIPWRINYNLRSLLGVFPDFVIAGFPKCGTTSLYNYLIQHPDILSADGKEQWYFSTFPLKPISWYKFRFPYKFEQIMSQMGLRTPFLLGDATPDYIYREESLKALKNYMPDAKIIILVRDPIKRSFSYFKHETRAGRINQSFDELIDYEYKQFMKRGILFHEDLYEHPQLKDTFLLGSLYSEYLKPLLDYYPKKQILLVSSEKFFSKPDVIFNNILDFLNVVPYNNIKFKVFNSGNYNITKIPKSEFLSEFYAPYNVKLERIFDMEFNWK